MKLRIPYISIVATLALALAGCGDSHDEEQRAVSVWQAVAIDGDTFWQGNDPVSYRLARIDAPEMPGHCRPGRQCVQGDPYASKRALQWFLNQGAACQVVGRDVYKRKLAECYVKRAWMLDSINDALVQLGFAERYRKP